MSRDTCVAEMRDLPASRRSFALTVPADHLVFNVYYVRIEAFDSLGQVGWDRKVSTARPVKLDPTIVPPPVPPAAEFLVGHPVPIDDDITHFQDGYLLLDGQTIVESFGAAGVLPVVVDASTDNVRLGLTDNARWSFSTPFTVRPDERIGDAAPSVELLAPTGGSFSGGSMVNIAWSASDDEGVRYVSLQGSYDGGLTYHDIVRRQPGELTSYDWVLPPLEETISNVLVRVVVEDLWFQNSSSTSGSITLTPGSGKEPDPGDLNGDGVVDGADLGELLGRSIWATHIPEPDVDGRLVRASDAAAHVALRGGIASCESPCVRSRDAVRRLVVFQQPSKEPSTSLEVVTGHGHVVGERVHGGATIVQVGGLGISASAKGHTSASKVPSSSTQSTQLGAGGDRPPDERPLERSVEPS